MSRKRARSNYRTEYYFDEKGVERVRYVYVAGTYDFAGSTVSFRVLYAVFSVLLAVAFLLPLCFVTRVFHTIYFTLPYVFQVFCAGDLLWAAYVCIRSKKPYKDKQKRTLFDHAKVFCVVGEFLAVGSLIAFAVYLLTEGATGYDFVAVASAVVCALSYFALYLNVTTKKLAFTPSEAAKENDSPASEEKEGDDSAPSEGKEGEDSAAPEEGSPEDSGRKDSAVEG